jgi:UDP-N-acetylglucosamine 1-carboxyvinyltransferase
MLNRMGANITGIGSNKLYIDGVDALVGTEHTMLPVMIEIGSWIGLAAMTKSEVRVMWMGSDESRFNMNLIQLQNLRRGN